MPRQYVFLVHGMGKMEKGEWHKLFVTAILKALKQYKPYKTMDAAEIDAEHLHFVPITYDSKFNEYREKWQGLADGVEDAIRDKSEKIGDVFHNLSESAATEGGLEGFFWSHLLDALLWYALPEARSAVVACVTDQIGEELKHMNKDERTSAAHVLAHSLGTTVTHDSLVALRWWPKHEGLFDPETHTWQTIGMVANVSRLLEATFTPDNEHPAELFKVHGSVLNPGADGTICHNYVNVHHTLDPFTWPRPFRPEKAVGGQGKDLEMTRIQAITRVHDFDHYFADPNVHLPLLALLTRKAGSICRPEEARSAVKDFRKDFLEPDETALQELRARLGVDPDEELSLLKLAGYLYAAMKELMT